MDLAYLEEPTPPTVRERMFVAYYFGAACGSGQKAAMMCGYAPSGAWTAAQRMMERPWVQAAIEAKIKEAIMTEAEALARLSAAATFDTSEFYELVNVPIDPQDPSKGTQLDMQVNLVAVQTSPHRQAIRSIKKNTAGHWTLTFHDKMDAIDKILKVHGSYAKNNVVTVQNNTPLDLAPDVARKIMEAVGGDVPPELTEHEAAD